LAMLAIPDKFWNKANNQLTYVFELCSLYNKIVRTYREPQVFLLTTFDGEVEAFYSSTDCEAVMTGVTRPNTVGCKDIGEVEDYVTAISDGNKTFEGVVIRDKDNRRWKIKSPEYVALHRMSNNGSPCSPKNILPFLLSGETDELYSYFPEVREYTENMRVTLNDWLQEVDNLWHCFYDEDNRKKFALAVKDSRLSWALFKAKDTGENPVDIVRNNPDKLLKMLK